MTASDVDFFIRIYLDDLKTSFLYPDKVLEPSPLRSTSLDSTSRRSRRSRRADPSKCPGEHAMVATQLTQHSPTSPSLPPLHSRPRNNLAASQVKLGLLLSPDSPTADGRSLLHCSSATAAETGQDPAQGEQGDGQRAMLQA
uniref:Uncharacterized protein n=1 Tax=Guillardia theta TaxID=55529 RepID=A0A6U5W5K3_GUITH|mmetsp:Transcript_12257/g.42705  ORF Transcript_12257/g.42705 Transcript_12257/m.42705 type:complete len:142 (+) Transcript_12257:574-999(+)